MCHYRNKIIEKEKIKILYKDNLALVLLMPLTFLLAIFTLYWSLGATKDFLNTKDDISFSGYFFTFLLASCAYIIYYVKSRIYAFLSKENKLKIYEKNTFYNEE